MTNPPTLSLHLTLDEVNTILNALGGLPYVQVYTLIQKVQGQAGTQLEHQNGQTASLQEYEQMPPLGDEVTKHD